MSKVGKIKTVCCKNFVTYSKCVFNPSEYLNVIIGPNGTGKSTLVSAIVLSLGGDPKILARSSSIGDYVKNGCESATVSVEVYENDDDTDCKTKTLQRTFDVGGKSQFSVNSQLVSQKEFLKIVAKYNIQISNLCQFLPQDRVQDFAKMDPQEILKNTINSVCSEDVVDNFKKLKELKNLQENGRKCHRDLVQKLEETMLRVDDLKVQLERFNKRKSFEEKLNVCNAKKLRLEIDELESKMLELEDDLKMAKSNLTKHEKEYSVLTKKQAMINSTTEKLKSDIEVKDRNLKVADDKKSQVIGNIEMLKKKIHEEKSKLEKRRRDWNERQNEIKHETKMLEVYAQDLRNLKIDILPDNEREQRLRACDQKIEQTKQDIRRLNQEHRGINNKLDEYIPEIQNLKNRLDGLENETAQKMQFLKSRFPDVHKAVQWLDNNMDLFEGRVYKPMIIELNVRDPNNAKYLENTINQRDLLAFSCESTTDLSVLTTKLCNEQKLLINIFHAPTPDDSILIPNVPIENIRQYGFDAYLIDLISGPPAILGFLCSLYNLQNIPVGTDRVNNCTDDIPKSIQMYFGGDLRYTLSTSKYGNRETSLMKNSIASKGWLSSKDENEISHIKKRLSELTRASDNLRNQRAPVEAKIREKEILCKDEALIKKEIIGKHQEFMHKNSQINRQKTKIITLKEEMIGIPQMESEFKEVGSKLINEIIKIQAEKVQALDTFQKAISHKAYSKTKLSIFKQESEELSNIISTAKEKRDSAKNRVEVITSKSNNLKRDCSSKLSEALVLTNNLDPTDVTFAHREFFSNLPNNLEELRDTISEFSGHLDCMDNVNPEIVREFEVKRNEVVALKNDIELNLTGNENYTTQIESIYNNWLPIIETVVVTINQHFGDFMMSMGYVGEVKLLKKEEFDFDSYGIEILVQYRKNVALQALNRHVQSGGERAVAIAVYTLSMQHITHVPFRCVDEINQGMDARNERKIFEMLVEETTKDGRAQYFFVTPKLLRNLKTHERMSVHVVYNGRMVESQNAFTFQI